MITPLLVALLALQSPLQVRAELIPPRTKVGEPVLLRVTAQASSGDRPHIPMPEFPLGLSVVGTSESTATSISVPGGRTTSITREYALLASAAGYYPIPPIRITAGRQIALTNSVTVAVAEGILAGTGSDARLEVFMDPDTIFVGQQSTLVAEVLMTADLQMRLTRPPSYQAPAPAEFWIQALDLQSQLGSTVRQGQRFNTQRFYRAYFPLTAGRFSFAPAKLLYEARQGFVFAPRQFELRSNSARLVVLPLPDVGKPADFRGAVGRFTVTASVSPQASSVGDAVTLTVEIKGAGNIKSLPPPVLSDIPQVEVLDPAESTEIDENELAVGGTKRFTWVLIPQRVGRIEIPAISYSAFDPAARRYTATRTTPLTLDVAPAAPGGPARVGGLRAQPKPNPLSFTRSRSFALAQLLPLLLLAAAWMVRRQTTGPSRSLRRRWRAELERAQRDPEPAGACERLLRQALFDATGQQHYRTGAVEELRAPLISLLGSDDGGQLAELLGRLESARFSRTPTQNDAGSVLHDQVEKALDRLWQHLRRSTRSSGLPLLLLLQSPAEPRAFEAGLEAYANRDIAAAVSSFRQHTLAYPTDPSGWYNLGIAHNAQREPAHAALAFLKAARLDPQARDVRDALRRAGVEALGRRVRPVTGLTSGGTLLVVSALWWLACILAAFSFLRRSFRYAWLALLPLAAAGLLIAASVVERALPPPALVLDQGAPLLSGMNLHAETLRQLQPLTGLSVMGTGQGWARVRTADGDEGWVRVERIGRP